mmetsp:Transcript_4857/g.14115  ORF Transcript_4857/g.14115 Transcript_4857/m.14115 type:complete len:308 (+) Transcript_4857:100-1023(+)
MNVKALIKRAKQEGATEHHGAKAPAEPASEEPLVLPASLRTVSEESLIDGLQHVHLLEDWLPLEAEAVLLRNLRARSRDFLQLRGKRTARYGGDPGPPLVAEPLPPWLSQLCSQVASTLATDSDASTAEALPPNHVLVNHYRPGEGIMPHTDGPAYEPRAAILSLGSSVVFSFWRDHAHTASGRPPALSLLLPPRSLLFFSGEAYSAHLHGIAEQRFDELHPGLANWTASARARWASGLTGLPEAASGTASWPQWQLELPPAPAEGTAMGEGEGYAPPALPASSSLRREERYSLTIRRVPPVKESGE